MTTVGEDLKSGPWAERLRDGTLQSLAAVRTMLSAGLRNESPEVLERAAAEALRQVDVEIASLRSLLGDRAAERDPEPLDDAAQASIRPRFSA